MLRKLGRFVSWSFRLLLLLAALDAFYLTHIWPDWEALSVGPVPQSRFIADYEKRRTENTALPPLQWVPVPLLEIAPQMQRAVIVAEDSRFFSHNGLDWFALEDALQYNLQQRRIVYGASTISQQTVKNLFLSGSRDPLRKWHEVVLTLAMEFHLSKDRILELYLNVAEFGHGIYGVEAASRHYWDQSASSLSLPRAVELAASLPSPKHHNPATRTPAFQARVRRITRHLNWG